MKKGFIITLVLLTGIFLLSASIVWAQAPAPVAKTGQTKCYDTAGTEISCEGTGQDGEYQKGVPWPNPRFRDWGDGTVTDNLTGLMWAKNANLVGTGMDWWGAVTVANNLTLGTSCGGTYTDWRLPNVKELQSLIDFSNYSPALPSGHPFTNVEDQVPFWSRTTSAIPSPQLALTISTSTGQTIVSEKSGYLGPLCDVWPVRGETAGSPAPVPKTGDDGDLQKGVVSPAPRFRDWGDGTVTDNLTGLMWVKDANLAGTGMAWSEALDFANNLTLGTSCGGEHTDWRLPNVKELQSLIDFGDYNPALPIDHPFLNIVEFGDDKYWTSTSDHKPASEFLARYAWFVAFYGETDKAGKGIHYYVWPVRSGN